MDGSSLPHALLDSQVPHEVLLPALDSLFALLPALQAINSWVADATEDKITAIVTDDFVADVSVG